MEEESNTLDSAMKIANRMHRGKKFVEEDNPKVKGNKDEVDELTVQLERMRINSIEQQEQINAIERDNRFNRTNNNNERSYDDRPNNYKPYNNRPYNNERNTNRQ